MGPSPLFSLKTSSSKPLSLLFAGLLLAPMAGTADTWWPDIQVEVKADVTAFGKAEPVKRDGRHSVILKCDGENSFAQRCKELQSK